MEARSKCAAYLAILRRKLSKQACSVVLSGVECQTAAPHGMHIGGGHTEVGAATSKSSPGACIHTKGVSADIAKPLYAALFIFM